ncbi:recombinase family protein [Paenibacillaceae bacterium]|nr:recombinase family protein [Paenibacillaceae bacterium]
MTNLDPRGEYWRYMRKSRADLEAEERGEGETLAKHDRALMKLARQHNVLITSTFREIVSGESLFHRPEMIKMLEGMEQSPPKGIFVMDMERLGRGNMQEQGLILDTFRRHKVLIITPNKIYDLNDESDELMTEVQALFARQELKVITRRLQRGRVDSVEEGNYIATRPPYGYSVVKEGKTRYLIEHPEQASIVRQVFKWYLENIGSNKIANRLNEMGVKSYTGKSFSSSAVLNMLKNEVYTGVIQWKKKEQKKSKTKGKKRDTRTRDRSEWISVPGKHEALVDEVTFRRVQERLKTKYHVPYQLVNGITNPLAGLVRCAKCGVSMVLRPYANQPAHIMCYNRQCNNRSARMEFVEKKVINALEEWLDGYKLQWKSKKKITSYDAFENTLRELEKELHELEDQKGRLFDFLERGIYTEEVFFERSNNLQTRMESNSKAIERTKSEMEFEKKKASAQINIIPQVINIIKLYRRADDPAQKNTLLKSILHHAEYNKEKTQRGDDFDLKLVLKIT